MPPHHAGPRAGPGSQPGGAQLWLQTGHTEHWGQVLATEELRHIQSSLGTPQPLTSIPGLPESVTLTTPARGLDAGPSTLTSGPQGPTSPRHSAPRRELRRTGQ